MKTSLPSAPPSPTAHGDQPPSLTFWILGCMREGQGGIWLRAAVISWVSTAARALQMAMTDWITRSAFSGKSPWRAETGLTWDPRAAEGAGAAPCCPHAMHWEWQQPVPQFPLLSRPLLFSDAAPQ